MKKLSTGQKIGLLAALLPPFLLGSFLVTKAVNVPFYDQWEIVPIIKNLREGNFTFHDYWQQHNEHRIFFPRLVMLASAVLTNWNTKVEAMLGFVIACVAFALLLKALDNTRKSLEHTFPAWLPFLLSSIWFSIVQWENWLWGWQIQWFLSVLGVVMVVYALTLIKDKKPDLSTLLLLIFGGILAQYSLGNGILIWPPLLLALVYMRIQLKTLLIVTVVPIITTGLYYLNYINPTNNPPKSYALHHPDEFITYFFAYLGRPLSYMKIGAPIMGIVLVSAFLGAGVFLYLKNRQRFNAMTAWWVLGLYALGSAFVTDISRLGFGLGQSLTSRYTTISSLLLVAIIVIYVNNRDIVASIFKSSYKYIYSASIILIFGMVYLNAWWGLKGANNQVQYLTDIRNCTHAEKPYDVCLLSTYPNEQTASSRLQYLKQIHWGGY